jgi:hypothetical protein
LKDEEGRIYLNPDGFAISKLDRIPHLVVSVIPGWEMEVMPRLNPDIDDLNFSDRMAPVIELISTPQAPRMKGKGERRSRRTGNSSK